MNGFPRVVVQLGLLSLLNDISSEMIFPVLPLFLATLPGGGPVAIGIIEGIAEATGTLLKLASGIWSDCVRKRMPFILSGYGIAGLARPVIAFAASWPAVLFLRFIDRVGKGIRGAPRDAVIADSVPEDQRGSAFGFQRMMDHTGAVIGPLVAMTLMGGFDLSVRQVILFAGIPSIMLVGLLFTLREPIPGTIGSQQPLPTREGNMNRDFRVLLAGMFLFTLGNSTDAFLILALSRAGVPAAFIAFLWSLHHMVKIVGAWTGGRLTDRLGSKPVILTALCLYGTIYLAFGAFSSAVVLVPVFIAYGASIGLLEPAEGAWVACLSTSGARGTAYGAYNAAKGIAALPASVIFGCVWKYHGTFAAFGMGAALAFVGATILMFVRDLTRLGHLIAP